jgi:2-oxo-4-hydroxy-4-carboxy--5-ureidoimidazoline (OHCU) decarboxylase/GNAT superfamily N-acetyltransferase
VALSVRDFVASDHDWARELIGHHQGGDHRVAMLGELVDPLAHQGLVAVAEVGRPVGLLTVVEDDRGFGVLTLHAEPRGTGAGSLLLRTAVDVARASDAARLWLLTTNDNLDAIAWYLRRGLTVARVHAGAVDTDRATVKPSIPAINPANGIAIRDLVEIEADLTDPDAPHERRFPRIEDLDRLPAEAAAALLGPLFEDAPRFLERLAAARPFGDDAGMLAAARELARTLPEDEQVELLAAHPRIGADPAAVSAISHGEQGYDEVAPAQEPWIAEELEALNDAYERLFGFRFVIFVAGRPRSAIVPILEASLRDERVSELRRGLDDVVYIAGDRLAKLRG